MPLTAQYDAQSYNFEAHVDVSMNENRTRCRALVRAYRLCGVTECCHGPLWQADRARRLALQKELEDFRLAQKSSDSKTDKETYRNVSSFRPIQTSQEG